MAREISFHTEFYFLLFFCHTEIMILLFHTEIAEIAEIFFALILMSIDHHAAWLGEAHFCHFRYFCGT